MKQGELKRKLPKDKHEKKSWQTRNEARKGKQEAHALAVLLNVETAQFEEDHLGVVPDDTEREAIIEAALFHAGSEPFEAAEQPSRGELFEQGVRTADYYREEGDPLLAIVEDK